MDVLNTSHRFIGSIITDDKQGLIANITVIDNLTQKPWTITIPISILTSPQHPCFVVNDGESEYVVRSRIALPIGF